MLGDKDATATISVKDLNVAKKFYEGILGLKLTPRQEPGSLSYQGGTSTIFIYESKFAGTNQATALTWIVGSEVEAVVNALRAKGVLFEHYDFPETTQKGDIHVAHGRKMAWFKDPDANIHALVGQ